MKGSFTVVLGIKIIKNRRDIVRKIRSFKIVMRRGIVTKKYPKLVICIYEIHIELLKHQNQRTTTLYSRITLFMS